MVDPVHNFYRGLSFHKVITLNQSPPKSWQELTVEMPLLPRGWYELAKLKDEDRIEFTREFWFSKIPFDGPNASNYEERLAHFFESLESIDILATQERERTPYELHMIYSLQDGAGFFHGSPPATSEMIDNMSLSLGQLIFPEDYLSFLAIHDGFCKFTDTGLIRTREMARTYLKFQERLEGEIIVTEEGKIVDPKSLVPFYEAFGLHCYQCFYSDPSHPTSKVGNVYYSDYERTFGEFAEQKMLEESLSFPSFLSWLTFYLEDMGFLS